MKQQDVFRVESQAHRVGLRMEVRGPGTYDNTLSYWRSIVAVLNERHPPGLLLVDKTSGPPLSAMEWKSLVDTMAGKGLEQVRIAHVKPFGLQRVEYCELYARELGFDARVFTDEAEADLWLRYGERSRMA